ncbi:nucleotide-binding protein [Vibrio parahaemolyticus]|uniref:TIR domain-containing protein n=2 Tax=Vibrio parahaemolyticus TaxID=670 RepID=UPI00186A481A|nr:nucleotide-binding protein [Vibrio parahaemolyticus]EGQ8181308.1 nucleotide-binding protein [Vibrio parahaemolyticus]EHD6031656.1 nucleotide-binding protein [Vibrio parahaemolyticus]EJR0958143.1 nucleotide-binding protein [Vibrio parahaemolyticus]EKY4210525.1 nucleotide-binding protein [Vibrio parahaemolyticus]EMA9662470.1 nucleotide-binding protein [Vibrio parahaemolyticus]
MKFSGCPQDLETVVAALGRNIKSSEDKGNMHQIKTEEGEVINLYRTGTMQVQGKAQIKAKFEEDYNSYSGSTPPVQQDTAPAHASTETLVASVSQSKQVFVVHGHDEMAREQLELVLHKLGIDHFILANSGGGGLTIIESLEAKIGQNSTATSFGIVLMTPDDMGYALSSGDESIQPRARQNVVLEMGMLISSIGRRNIAILVKGHLERPSDADGILYIPFNNHVKETVPRLAARLKESGFVLNPDKVAHASS